MKHLIKENYQEIYKGQPWYGASILETLQAIPFPVINIKVMDKSHSVAELVKHMLSWRNFVIEKLKENNEFEIELNSLKDWKKDLFISDEKEWKTLIKDSIDSIEEIIKEISKKDEEWFLQTTKGKDYNNEYMIRGIIYHDIYHLGQIRLIQKLAEGVF